MSTNEETEIIPHSASGAEAIFEYAATFPQDLSQRRDLLDSLEAAEAIEMIQLINAMVQGSDGLAAFDRPAGDYVNDTYVLDESAVPDLRDAEGLLAQAWAVAKELLADYEIPDAKSLQLAGITMANAVLLVHPFRDGNGRTSRAMSYIMAYEQPTLDDIEAVVSSHIGGKRWLVQPQYNQRTAPKTDSRQPARVGKLWLIEDDSSIEYMLSNTVDSVRTGTFRSLIERHADIFEGHLAKATDEFGMLDSHRLVLDVTREQDIAMAVFAGRALVGAYREARAEVVESFLADMKHSPTFRNRQLWALAELSSALSR